MKILISTTIFSLLFSLAQTTTGLKEQVGQLLIPCIDGEVVDANTHTFLRTHCPGGVILYNWCNKLDSREQVKALCSGLQKQAADLNLPPLFISVDQEGGLVSRLDQGFTQFPGNAALGRANCENLAFLSAREMGYEMMNVGVNFTFAPVVDVNCNPDNPIIGIRSYGNTPELVTKMGLAASRGFSDAGIISCLKHFPGHGDVTIDSHESLPVLTKSKSSLSTLELAPFRTILNTSPAMMTAHLRVLSLDRNHCATLSKRIVTDLLRKELGYQGLIVTDSLTMGAIVEECGDIGEAAVQAFEAGSDLLLVGGQRLDGLEHPISTKELMSIQTALLKAVETGRITRSRLQESLDRILKTKEKFHIGKKAPIKGDHLLAKTYAYTAAKKAVRIEEKTLSPQLWKQNIIIIAPQRLEQSIEKSDLIHLGKSCQTFYFEGLNPDPKKILELEKQLTHIDAIIFISYNAWQFAGQASLLSTLSKKFPLTLIAARDARDAQLDIAAHTIITTVSPTSTAFKVVFEHLNQRLSVDEDHLPPLIRQQSKPAS